MSDDSFNFEGLTEIGDTRHQCSRNIKSAITVFAARFPRTFPRLSVSTVTFPQQLLNPTPAQKLNRETELRDAEDLNLRGTSPA